MGNINPICCIHGLHKLFAANWLKRPAVFSKAADLLLGLVARQDRANNLGLYGLACVNRGRGWRLAWGPGGWWRREGEGGGMFSSSSSSSRAGGG